MEQLTDRETNDYRDTTDQINPIASKSGKK